MSDKNVENPDRTGSKARVLIVTDKDYVLSGGRYFSYGGTQKEFKAISDICDLSVLVSVEVRPTPPEGYEVLPDNIQVYSNGWIRYWHSLPALWIMFLTFLRVISLQRRYRFDIIVGKAPREVGIGAVLAAKATGIYSIFHYSYDWIPVVIDNKGLILNGLLCVYRSIIWSFRKKALRLACLMTDQVATVSHEFARQLSTLSGIALQEISFLRTTFTLQDELFEVAPINDHTPLNVLFVGRMDSNKNVATLIKGFAIARDRGFCGALILAGRGPEFENLQKLTLELQLEDSISFLGYVDNSKLASLLEQCFLLVLPSFSEGFPKVLLEASAAARPLLGSAIDGNREIIVPERNGYLFDPESPADLADKLLKIRGGGQRYKWVSKHGALCNHIGPKRQ